MDKKRVLGSLVERERFVLTRWAMKTACALEHSAGYPIRFIPDDHRAWLFSRPHSIPAGVTLFATVVDASRPIGSEISRRWLAQSVGGARQSETLELMNRSYKVSMQFGHLILLVAYWPPSSGWRIARLRGVHFNVWPVECEFENIPWYLPGTQDSKLDALAFESTLGISYGKWITYPEVITT